MKLEDIQPGRRYYLRTVSNEHACFIAKVIVKLDSGEMVLRSQDSDAVFVLREQELDRFIAPVPDNWLRRLLKGGD